jgi:hypothetical protein
MSISQNFPTSRPSLNINFARSKTLDPRITFTRSSSATYVDDDGFIKTSAVDRPRFDHNPSTGESLGLLVEEQRTNLINQSQHLFGSSWSEVGTQGDTITIVPNATLAPNNTFTASYFKENFTSSAEHLLSYNYTGTGAHTFSFFVKDNGVERILFYFRTGVSGIIQGLTYFNFSTESLSGIFGDNATVQKYPNGWYKLSLTCSLNGWTTVAVRLCRLADYQYNGNGVSGIYIWGAQLEAGSFPTSYIPTIPTFTSRASSATYYDSTGILRTAATNVARSDTYFPDSSGIFRPAGLLLEPSSINYQLSSSDFTTSYWAITYGITRTANAITAPDGTTTATLIQQDTSNTIHHLGGGYSQNSGYINFSASSIYTNSIFVKKFNSDRITFMENYTYGDSTTGSYTKAGIVFDFTTESVVKTIQWDNSSQSRILNYTVNKLPNGWYRLSLTISAGSDSNNARVYFGLYPHDVTLSTTNNVSSLSSIPSGAIGITGANYFSGSAGSFVGNGSTGVYVWGAQVELSYTSSSYIGTTTASVTRAADLSTSSTVTRAEDNASITGSNFSSWYNQDGGTFYVSGKAINGVNARILAFSDATTGVIFVAANGSTNSKGIWGPSNLVNVYGYAPFGEISLYSNYRAAATIAPGSYTKYSLNGQIATTNNLPNGNVLNPTVLNIGPNASGGGKGNLISRIAYYPKEFTASEVQNLTKS